MRAALSTTERTAPFSAATTIQAIIVSAQCGILKDLAAFVAVGAFVAAVALCLPA